MSSSPQSVRKISKRSRQAGVRFSSVTCPMCGRRALVDVVADCKLSSGRIVKQLPHTRCEICGERFFDVAAMAAIEKAARPLSRKRTA